MLPLEYFTSTCYETAARIKIMSLKCDLLEFVVFAYEIALKSQPANETTLLNLAWEHQNIDYFIGFIDSCDGETKPMNLMKIRQMHEPGGDELLLILGRF